MKSNKESRNLPMAALVLIGVVFTLTLTFCGGDSSTGSGGGPGPNPNREFESQNLGPGATYTHVFNTAKVVPYYCEFHGGPGGSGMSGVITVNAAGSPNKHNLSIISDTDLPDRTIEAGDTITWTNNTGMLHTVESDN